MRYSKILALMGLMLLTVGIGFTQTPSAITTTTLSAAATATQNYVLLTSATGVTVSPQTTLYVEGERMDVLTVSGTTIGVSRTDPKKHVSGAVVFIGRPDYFQAINAAKPLLTFGMSKITNIPVGAVAYGSLGNDTATVDGTIFTTEIFVPYTVLPKGLGVLYGTTTSTDKYIVAIFDDQGTLLCYSDLAGTTYSGSADTFHEIAFSRSTPLVGPKRYWASIQANGTTSHVRTVAASTYLVLGKSATGTFGTLSLTPPTTLTANTAPICYIY